MARSGNQISVWFVKDNVAQFWGCLTTWVPFPLIEYFVRNARRG